MIDRPTTAPTLTADLPGTGGVIKQRPEDFLVEETPLYEPAGEGEHLYLFIEKRGMSTMQLTGLLANHFDVPKRAVGVAGLKDKHAITRQVVSIHAPGKRFEDFPMIRDERVGVLWTDYHTNKLRRGHLKGNRFSIRIRGVSPTAVVRAKPILARLEQRGVPNRFGPQRFGFLENNHQVGAALLRGDHDAALTHLLGPGDLHPESQPEARAAFAQGDFAEALSRMPNALRTEQAALRVLARGGSPKQALAAMGRGVGEYYLAAFQSAIFNTVLDQRLADGSWDRILPGDIAQIARNRACFTIDEETAGNPDTPARLGRFEIAPTGPMWGPSMMRASGAADELEVAALAEAGFAPDELKPRGVSARWTLEGDRRPLRIPLIDPDLEGGVDEHGPFVRVAFELPRGAFATTVLHEIMKTAGDGTGDDSDSE